MAPRERQLKLVSPKNAIIKNDLASRRTCPLCRNLEIIPKVRGYGALENYLIARTPRVLKDPDLHTVCTRAGGSCQAGAPIMGDRSKREERAQEARKDA